jgi:hypothetical protein
MKVMTELNKLTYAVQHSPNSPSPFLVRLIGRGQGVLDYKLADETKDICGYGTTLRQAAEEALKARAKQKPAYNAHRSARRFEMLLPGVVPPTPFPRD